MARAGQSHAIVERQLGHPLERTSGPERVTAVSQLRVSRYTIYGDLRASASTGSELAT